MIFNVPNHIEQIIAGEKTQTRRGSNQYQVGKSYSIQPKRCMKGIKDGRILIIEKWREERDISKILIINIDDAIAEGGYSPAEFEALYEKIDPRWEFRIAYKFKYLPNLMEK